MNALLPSLFVCAALLAAKSAEAACARPTSAGGYGGIAYDTPAAHLDGPRVRVHYTLEGKHALADAELVDGVPRGAKVVVEEVENALDAFASLGFAPPPSDISASCDGDGDARYDIYLINFTAGDGQTVPESCRGGSCASFALAARDLKRRYGSSERGVRTVVVHELFHAVQFGITRELPPFWSEGTAQWAADKVHPELTDLEGFLPTFFEAPERPLDSQGAGAVGAWQYATAIWPVFLDQAFGAVKPILDAFANEDDFDKAAEVGLASRGSSLAEAFTQFGCWNAATGARAAGDGYTQAAKYPQVTLDAVEGDTVDATLTGLSTRYFELTLEERTRLRVTERDPERMQLRVLGFDGDTLPVANPKVLEDTLELDAGRYVLVLSSTTSAKRDNRVSVQLEPISAEPTSTPAADDGCTVHSSSPSSFLLFALGLLWRASTRRRAPAAPKKVS